jgi:hypothetical protein
MKGIFLPQSMRSYFTPIQNNSVKTLFCVSCYSMFFNNRWDDDSFQTE